MPAVRSVIAFLKRRRQAKALRQIEATRKPDPLFWKRRLAQLPPERRMRALLNAGIFSPELWERM